MVAERLYNKQDESVASAVGEQSGFSSSNESSKKEMEKSAPPWELFNSVFKSRVTEEERNAFYLYYLGTVALSSGKKDEASLYYHQIDSNLYEVLEDKGEGDLRFIEEIIGVTSRRDTTVQPKYIDMKLVTEKSHDLSTSPEDPASSGQKEQVVSPAPPPDL